MVDDSPEAITPSPDSGRARRPPPTIDLEATEVSGETENAASGGQGGGPLRRPGAAVISSAIVAAVSGASAAALVIGIVWLSGWPGDAAPPTAARPADTSVIDGLASRVADIEARSVTSATATPDPQVAARIEALEKSLTSLRSEIAVGRAQSEKLAGDLNDVKSTMRQASAPPQDLSGINERIAQIERATRAQTAQESSRPADDMPLRRVVAAALLDILVRTGDPYVAALAAAKSLAANPETLKPLDGFAATGVPSAAALSRELLTLVPKLSPPAPENATTGSGLVNRLQAGAAKLVRIERTDAVGTDRGAVVTRMTAAALRNDFAEARRELNTLAPSDRAAAQVWLDKADARDAALAFSRKFAADAMAALAKPAP